MKKQALLFAVLASVASFNSYAGNTYIGAGLGIQSIDASTSKFRGWRPGLFIGYGDRMDEDNDCYYLAGELAISWASEMSDQYTIRSQSLRISPELSLSLIPGMIFAPDTMGYLRLGLGEGRQRATTDWLRAVIVGAGVEYNLTPAWAIRGEVDYTTFKSVAVIGVPRSWDGTISFKYTYDA